MYIILSIMYKFSFIFINLISNLKFSRIFESSIPKITSFYLLGIIEDSLRQIFGDIGGCSDIVVLNFNDKNQSAVIRCLNNFSWKLQAALSLISNYQNIRCKIDINKTLTPDIWLLKTHC